MPRLSPTRLAAPPSLPLALMSGLLLLAPSCGPSHATAPTPASAALQAAPFEGEVDRLLRHQALAAWQRWTGQAPPTYDGPLPPKLYTSARLKALRAGQLGPVDPEAQAALERLLLGELLATRLQASEARLVSAYHQAEVSLGDQRAPLSALPRLLATTPSPYARAHLDQARLGALDALAPVSQARAAALAQALAELELGPPNVAAARLRGVAPGSVLSSAQVLLAKSAPAHAAALAWLSRARLDLAPEALQATDIDHLFLVSTLSEALDSAPARGPALDTLKGLGLDLAPVLWATAATPAQGSAPLFIPVDPPDDLRLGWTPQGGAEALAALLRELGVALAWRYAPREPLALGRLAPPHQAEAYGRLFAGLLRDPQWLQAHAQLPAPEAARLARAFAARDLWALRVEAARTIFEAELEAAPPGALDPAARWRHHLGEALGRPASEAMGAGWHLELGQLYPSAAPLAAEALAATLRAELIARFGPRWWGVPAAGQWLKARWETPGARRASPAALTQALSGPWYEALVKAASPPGCQSASSPASDTGEAPRPAEVDQK